MALSLEEELRALEIEEVSELEALARPAIKLVCTPSAAIALGASRFGGDPDLPDDFA